jgi:hypothetical protein
MEDMMGGGMMGGGSTSQEFGRSSAESTVEGDTIGLQFDQKTIIVIAISAAALFVGLAGLFLMLKR